MMLEAIVSIAGVIISAIATLITYKSYRLYKSQRGETSDQI